MIEDQGNLLFISFVTVVFHVDEYIRYQNICPLKSAKANSRNPPYPHHSNQQGLQRVSFGHHWGLVFICRQERSARDKTAALDNFKIQGGVHPGNIFLCVLVFRIAGKAQVVTVEHPDIYICTSSQRSVHKYIGRTTSAAGTTNGGQIPFRDSKAKENIQNGGFIQSQNASGSRMRFDFHALIRNCALVGGPPPRPAYYSIRCYFDRKEPLFLCYLSAALRSLLSVSYNEIR